MTALARLARDARGATAIEYALIACLIAIVIVSAVQITGTQVGAALGKAGTGLN